MPNEFRLPDIGEGLTEAEIVTWHVAVGDEVEVDQLIVDVETAKTVVEIPSPHAGTMVSLNGSPGSIVEVGDVLFVVSSDGTIPMAPAEPPAELTPAPEPPDTKPSPTPQPAPSVPATPTDGPRAMPVVRKLAAERGIDLTAVAGTGPGGSITRNDVEGFTPADSPAGDLVRLSPTRRAIAEHMMESWRTIPHVTVQAEIRAEALLTSRTASETPLSIEAIIAERLLPILKQFPEFNATFVGDSVLHRTEYHLGFAVDTEAGLLVVVIDDADDMTTAEIHDEFTRLAAAAKDRTLTMDEVTGQTFTISNIGALGGGHGTPIIPVGTTAIMSIGRATEQPVVVDGTLEVGLVAPIDLSYDHRVIDGGLGQRFLSTLTEGLER
jgi:pyruvate/2-oxoglutarate dehydrogenase complex dihydrolipoamide acyltransferase (E2) component